MLAHFQYHGNNTAKEGEVSRKSTENVVNKFSEAGGDMRYELLERKPIVIIRSVSK